MELIKNKYKIKYYTSKIQYAIHILLKFSLEIEAPNFEQRAPKTVVVGCCRPNFCAPGEAAKSGRFRRRSDREKCALKITMKDLLCF